MVQAGRELWSSSSSTSLLKKDPLEPSLRVVPTGLGISSRKETPKPPWAPVPLLSHLTTKKFFLVLRWNFVFQKHTYSIPSIWEGGGIITHGIELRACQCLQIPTCCSISASQGQD